MSQPLKVLFLAAEATPFAQVGGLAEVAASLPKALRGLGVDVRLLIPRYGNIRSDQYAFRRVGESVGVPVGPEEEKVHLLETVVDDLPVYLIWDQKYFSAREKIYGFNDDPQRFTFFSRAIIAALHALPWKPDVIHANDWHTAPVIAWLDSYGRDDPFYRDLATLFTIHNLAYQGLCGRLILTFAQMEKVAHLAVEPPGKFNCLAQGIALADVINTTSPTYARDILMPEYGLGLDPLLQARQENLFGILNGIDTEIWNPDIDAALAQTYTADTLSMRAVNKAVLQREVGLPVRPEVPLLSFVAHLNATRGLDVLLAALEALIVRNEVQFVLLGTGEAHYEDLYRDLQSRFPESVRVFIKHDNRLARRIYGGADIFLMPSLFEPCGLGQMIAMRYGVIPVARATGGLNDTIVDVRKQPQRGTGYLFRDYTVEALLAVLDEVFVAYAHKPTWEALQRRAMQVDFSWQASAHAYLDLYQRALVLHATKKK